MFLLCLLAVSLAGCGQSSFWAYGDNDALGIRAGTKIDENVELGVASLWWPQDDGDSQAYGAYALYHLPGDPVGAYVGAQTDISSEFDEYISPVAGVMFDEIFFTEYQYKSFENKAAQEEDKIVFGVRLKF
jgi:hypothetical protein